jgi:3-oxoacyl-(acyl-carrier-protein) synthase/acyl carrier protein
MNPAVSSQLEVFIIEVIAAVMRIPKEKIKTNVPFSTYGIDSLIILEILKPFKEKLGYLPSTLFFEYPTIEKLINYFLEHKTHEVSLIFNVDQQEFIVEDFREKLKNYLKETIGNVMKIEPNKISNEVPFKDYGIDSLITLEILKPLKKDFEYLPSTILFEYPTLNALIEYLLAQHLDLVKKIFKSNTGEIKEVYNLIAPNNLALKESIKDSINSAIYDDDIAIIGIAGQFPKSRNIDEFWENLQNGMNCIIEIPEERWDNSSFYSKTSDNYEIGKTYTNYGGFIDDIEYFDNRFFTITPYDAENMDPQERLFLQLTYNVIQDSGYSYENLSGKDVGVFLGVMNGGYGWLGVDSNALNWADSLYWSIPNRVSYFFNWFGPSIAVDSACSSSLTAVHQGCLAIKNGDASFVIVGGVNAILHPKQYTKLCRLNMLSHEHTCKSFGDKADGFVDGEGIAAIALKKHSEAIKDKDRIYAIIKGSAINSGGKANGYTAPNPTAQADLIKKALNNANFKANTITYVEAHGTGTELGDPVEIRGLVKAFDIEDKECCFLGSVKSNIGHLESAAGLAGLIKVVLQMQHRKLVPSLHCSIENHHINLKDTPFKLVKKLTDWNVKLNVPRRAIISSFGAGGANANVVMEEASYEKLDLITLHAYLLPLSAHTLQSLKNQILDLLVWCQNQENLNLYSLAYTLACVRSHHSYRACLIVSNHEELLQKLTRELINFHDEATHIQNNEIQSLVVSDLTTISSDKLITELGKISNFYLEGKNIKWDLIYTKRRVISLPPYGFNKIYHWISRPKHGLSRQQRLLSQHKINNISILPASYSLNKMLTHSSNLNSLSNVYWLIPLKDENIEIKHDENQIVLQSSINGTTYVKAEITEEGTHLGNNEIPKINVTAPILVQREIYHIFNSSGYNYGSLYKKLKWVIKDSTVSLGFIEFDSVNETILDPNIIDAGLQIAILMFPKLSGENFVPFYLKNFRIISRATPELLYCYCVINPENSTSKNIRAFDLFFVNEKNEPLIILENMISKSYKQAHQDEFMSDNDTASFKFYDLN